MNSESNSSLNSGSDSGSRGIGWNNLVSALCTLIWSFDGVVDEFQLARRILNWHWYTASRCRDAWRSSQYQYKYRYVNRNGNEMDRSRDPDGSLSIIQLATSTCAALESLHISGVDITPRFIHTLANNLAYSLSHLTFNGCHFQCDHDDESLSLPQAQLASSSSSTSTVDECSLVVFYSHVWPRLTSLDFSESFCTAASLLASARYSVSTTIPVSVQSVLPSLVSFRTPVPLFARWLISMPLLRNLELIFDEATYTYISSYNLNPLYSQFIPPVSSFHDAYVVYPSLSNICHLSHLHLHNQWFVTDSITGETHMSLHDWLRKQFPSLDRNSKRSADTNPVADMDMDTNDTSIVIDCLQLTRFKVNQQLLHLFSTPASASASTSTSTCITPTASVFASMSLSSAWRPDDSPISMAAMTMVCVSCPIDSTDISVLFMRSRRFGVSSLSLLQCDDLTSDEQIESLHLDEMCQSSSYQHSCFELRIHGFPPSVSRQYFNDAQDPDGITRYQAVTGKFVACWFGPHISSLGSVSLSWLPSINDDAIRTLSHTCPSLTSCCFAGTNITDQACIHLCTIKLYHLSINHTQVTSLGISRLCSSSNVCYASLCELDIRETCTSSAVLPHLALLPSLCQLGLGGKWPQQSPQPHPQHPNNAVQTALEIDPDTLAAAAGSFQWNETSIQQLELFFGDHRRYTLVLTDYPMTPATTTSTTTASSASIRLQDERINRSCSFSLACTDSIPCSFSRFFPVFYK